MFDRGSQMTRAAAGIRYVATVSVWIHWFVIAACFVPVFYLPPYGPPGYAAYWLLYLTLVALNAYVHYRLASGRTITWRWIFAHSAVDTAVVSAAAAVGGGFGHYFIHLLYYPVLACFAVFFTSLRLNMAFVTAVVVAYSILSPPPWVEGHISFQPQSAGIQSDGDES